MSLVVESVQALARALAASGATARGSLIGLDGALGSGKSTLGRALAHQIGARLVEGDLFLVHGKLRYPQALDIPCLKNVLTRALAYSKPVIFESVLLRLVLRDLGFGAHSTVYVRRMLPSGAFADSELFRPQPELAASLAEANEIRESSGCVAEDPLLPIEVLEYHLAEKPVGHATFLFNAAPNAGV